MCMMKARIRWCSCRVENILTLSKLLRLWFCFLLHSILFFISQTSYCTFKIISSYELARPIMGTIFLVYIQYWPKVIQQFKNCTKITTVKTKWLNIIIISSKYIQKLVILVFEWVSLVLVNRYIINKTVAKQNNSVAM